MVTITLTDEQIASIKAQLGGAPAPNPSPSPTPQPTSQPSIPGYRKVWYDWKGVFPAPATSNQRQYTSGVMSDDLIVMSFNAPTNANYLGIAVSFQGSMRTFEWSISKTQGDFDAPLFRGSGTDLSFNFATNLTSKYTMNKIDLSKNPNPLYFNLRFADRSVSENSDVVLFLLRPTA